MLIPSSKENFMTRASLFLAAAASSALCLSLVTGCERAADDQAKANGAQAEANTKITQAKIEANEKVNNAQAEADMKIAAAQGDFSKRREDFRHKLESDVIDLDKKIDVLEAKSKTATGKGKADLDANLAVIRTQRAKLATDVRGLETASAATWDDTKARIEKELGDLKSAVDKG
jgi:hypothetical protein